MSTPNLKKIISSAPSLAKASLVRRLSGGPTSTSWLLKLDNENVVLRADKPLANVLRLDRVAELEVLAEVARAGFGPPVLWADPGRGLLVTHYISGSHWRKSDASTVANIERLAWRMREIHAAKIPAPVLNIEATAHRYAELTGTIQSRDLFAHVKSLLKTVPNDLTEYGFCHNDPGYRNIVDTGDIWLIDWEYAATGLTWFDIAGVVVQNHYSRIGARCFTAAYFGEYNELLERRLKLFNRLYDLVSALWYHVICMTYDNMANQARLRTIMRRVSRGAC